MEPVNQHPKRQNDSDVYDVTSWASVCARGLWKVQRKRTHISGRQTASQSKDDAYCTSGDCPRMGSLCRVRVRMKADENEAESSTSVKEDEELLSETCQSLTDLPTSFPRSLNSVLHVPMGEWMTLRLGEGQCDVTEACVEGMRAGEQCEILLTPVEREPGTPAPQAAEGTEPLHAIAELHSFTPGLESWQMSPVQKWEWVRSHKERGGARFKSGDVWGAGDSYARALKLLITLRSHLHQGVEIGEAADGAQTDPSGHGKALEQPADSELPSLKEYQSIKAELHSNLSLCQLRLNQPQRARDSAAKATTLEPSKAKAWYRLGQACLMLNQLSEARQAFRKLLELQPDSPVAQKALRDIASREKETNMQLGRRLSKMFS